jgi:hypothetical protein
MRYRLRTLLLVLTVGPPVLAGVWFTRNNVLEEQDYYDMWKDPARYSELETELVRRGIAERRPDGQLGFGPKFPKSN